MELSSSKNMVPPWVFSNSPALFTDPVKGPFGGPKEDASKRFSGMAEQLTGVYFWRLLALWL